MEVNKKQTFDNFIVGKSNEKATKLCKGYRLLKTPLLIIGDTGVGKTHLLNAIVNSGEKKVLYLTSYEFCNNLIDSIFYHRYPAFKDGFFKYDVILIDNLEDCLGKESTIRHLSSMVQEWAKRNIIVILASGNKNMQEYFDFSYVAQIEQFDEKLSEQLLNNELKRYDQNIVEKYKLNLLDKNYKNMYEIFEAMNEVAIDTFINELKF